MGAARIAARWWWAVVGAIVVADAALAVRADRSSPSAESWLAVVDVGTGAAFVIAALLAKGAAAQRWLFASVGIAWLAGSWLPGTSSVHQGLLIVALVTFPSGRLTGRRSVVVVALGLIVASGGLPQPEVAVAFAGAAVVIATDRARGSAARRYPVVAGGSCAAVLFVFWSTARSTTAALDPDLAFLAWSTLLALVAVTFAAASRIALRERQLVAERALGRVATTGVRGLAEVLGPALGDETLRIERLPHPRAADDAASEPVDAETRGTQRLVVYDLDRPVAVVEHRTPALADPLTAQAVSSAVRLTVTHLRLQEEQQQRLTELAASRLRLLEATDRARAAVAVELRSGVGASLTHVRDVVAGVRDQALSPPSGPADPDAVAALDIVLAELRSFERDVGALVDGVPPVDLGDGRLAGALAALVSGSPVPCALRTTDPSTAASTVAESTIYYVCSEALANAVKHARSSRVDIDLRRTGADLTVSVTDDGVGGADPNGSGLRGLADRVAAHGGRLGVVSPPGGGTVINATLPAVS